VQARFVDHLPRFRWIVDPTFYHWNRQAQFVSPFRREEVKDAEDVSRLVEAKDGIV
jgi:hypothetical protein